MRNNHNEFFEGANPKVVEPALYPELCQYHWSRGIISLGFPVKIWTAMGEDILEYDVVFSSFFRSETLQILVTWWVVAPSVLLLMRGYESYS